MQTITTQVVPSRHFAITFSWNPLKDPVVGLQVLYLEHNNLLVCKERRHTLA